MWLPLAPRMLWVVRCHEGGGVVVGGSRCSALFGGAGVAGARAVWRWSAAQGLRALGRFVDAGWQDSRVVHDSRGSVQRKGVLPGKIFAPCVPERRFAGLFGCMARISCQSQLISDAWRANLAANWRFSRPRPLSGCMERKTCHGLPPGNAFREHFANGAASSCGRVYCLAIALVPHESDDLFVQAVLCT